MKVKIPPIKLNGLNIREEVAETYEDTVYNGTVITSVGDVQILRHGNISPDGSITYDVNVQCTVVDPVIGDRYTIKFTNSNKMGAIYRSTMLSIFVPKHYCIEDNIPDIGCIAEVQILAKRIEGVVTCIAKIVTQ